MGVVVAPGRGVDLLGGGGLARDAEAGDRRLDAGPLSLGDRAEHLRHQPRHLGRHHLPAHRGGGLGEDHPGRVGDLLHQDRLEEAPSVGDGGHRHRELDVGHADALTEGRRRRLDRHPGSSARTQHPGGLTREGKPRSFTEAEATEGLVGPALAEAERDLGDTDVGGDLEDLRGTQPLADVGVMDDDVVDRHVALLAVDLLVGLDRPARQGRGHGEGLHRRARLKEVHGGAVAALGGLAHVVVVGVVDGCARHREDLTRVRVHDHDAAALRLVGLERSHQLTFREELNGLVDGEVDVVPGQRCFVLNALGEDETSGAITQTANLLGATPELIVEGEFETVATDAVWRDEAEERAGQLTVGIEATSLPLDDEPAHRVPLAAIGKGADGLDLVWRHAALEPGETAPAAQLRRDLVDVQMKRRTDALGVAVDGSLEVLVLDAAEHLHRVDRYAGHFDADRERRPLAVVDRAPLRCDPQVTQALLLRQGMPRLAVGHLDVPGAAKHHAETRGKERAQERDPKAYHSCALRIDVVHGWPGPPSAIASFSSSSFLCRSRRRMGMTFSGGGGDMESSVRPTISTRWGVW